MPGKGRPFAKGNPGGPGRPKREVEEQYLQATISSVPLTKWKEVVAKALAQALEGDKDARAWLSKYLLPVPKPEDPAPAQDMGAILLTLQAALTKKGG